MLSFYMFTVKKKKGNKGNKQSVLKGLSDLHSVEPRRENNNAWKTIRVTKHSHTLLWVPAKLHIILRANCLMLSER